MLTVSIIFALVTMFLTSYINTTVDLNAAELQYLADHLTNEECNRLIAAAHLKSYQEPNSLDQAERKISKDLSCIEKLHHWNSEPGEGKGETHELLEHRLRQMDKYELADWLGRTVFHQLAVDLNRSLEVGLKELASEPTPKLVGPGPTLVPVVRNYEETEWSWMDTLLQAVIVGLILAIVAFSARLMYVGICKWRTSRKRKVRLKRHRSYDFLDEATSDSGSEDKFDLRDHTGKNNLSSYRANE